MSVTSVKEETRGRSSTLTGITSGDLTREFVVKCSARTDNEYTIYASGQIPLHGSPHPHNFLASLRNIRFKCERAFVWRVSCEYSTKPESQQQTSVQEIAVPWFRPAIVNGNFQSNTREFPEDAFGKKYVNSAGQAFSNAVAVDDDRPVFQIRKNVPSLPSWFYSLRRKRNDSAIAIRNEIGVVITAPAKTLRYRPLGFSEVKREGSNGQYRYIEVSYELIYDEDLWELDVLDRGYAYKPNVASRVQRVVPFDEGGEGFLDGTGGKLLLGSDPVKIHFKPYGDADFSVLPTS